MTTRHYPLELDPDVAKCLNCRALRAVRAFNLNSADEADLRQEAYLHLLRYAPTFDPSKSSWKTFIEMLIETGINMYLRQCLRYRRELSGGDPVYTEHLFSVEGPSELSKKYVADGTVTLDLLIALQEVFPLLDPLVQRICRLAIDGVSRDDIAATVGLTRAAVDYRLNLLWRHLSNEHQQLPQKNRVLFRKNTR